MMTVYDFTGSGNGYKVCLLMMQLGLPFKRVECDILKGETLEERIYRMRCVEAWSMVIPWVGFPLSDLIKKAEPTSKAKFVEFTTLMDPSRMPGQRYEILDWPYVEGLRIDAADDQEPDMLAGLDPASDAWGVRRPGTEAVLRTVDDSDAVTESRVPLERGAWTAFYPAVEQAVRGLRPAPVDIADAVADARILDAARLASQTGVVVTLDPPAAHRSGTATSSA